ncbi:MAG: hypothetical protein FWD47_03180 [Treponema sp.]|nr:hypothetical protein [Treponema sp.]
MKIRLFTLIILTSLTIGAFSQSIAQEMENLLATSQVSYAQAARFILRASGSFTTANQEDAFWFAATRSWLPENINPQDSARLDAVCLLLMKAFNIEGGIMYSITKNPHYAYRELVYKNIVQGNVDPFTRITGEQLIFYVNRVFAFLEREDETAAAYAQERRTLETKEKMEPTSLDLGILFTQNTTAYGNFADGDQNLDYKLGITPRASFILSDIGFLYVSAGFTLWYDEEFYVLPELLRTELSFRFGRWGLNFGRFVYTDPLGFVTDSLLDGFQITHTSGFGRLSLGAWFTGMLYKNNAQIIMTESDKTLFELPIDINNFADTYFAPYRAVASINWEHPSVGGIIQLNTSLVGQFDLNTDKDERLHSQYFILKIGIPINTFSIILGGSFGLTQVPGNMDYIYAGELGLFKTFPDKNAVLSFTARHASGGESGDSFGAFIPITAVYYGQIFKSKITGLTTFAIDYQTRISNIFGASFNVSYFARNDLSPVESNIVAPSEAGKHLLGAEIYTSLIFSPFSDLQFILGAGVFVPMLGNNWSDAGSVWRVDLTSIFALY